MRKNMIIAAVFAAMATTLWTTPAGARQTVPTTELAWMSGHWRSVEGDTVSEELWTDGDGGLMLGTNRTVRDQQAIAFEFMRIEISPDGTQARYCAQPGGSAATCFLRVDQSERQIRFENPDHDFPQAIEYRRTGDSMTATVSDLSGTYSLNFSWQRVPD